MLGSSDQVASAFAALAVGNLAVEPEARRRMEQEELVQSLASSLRSSHPLAVRYSMGAVRNLSVSERGRELLLQDLDLSLLDQLCSSPDRITSSYASAALLALQDREEATDL